MLTAPNMHNGIFCAEVSSMSGGKWHLDSLPCSRRSFSRPCPNPQTGDSISSKGVLLLCSIYVLLHGTSKLPIIRHY